MSQDNWIPIHHDNSLNNIKWQPKWPKDAGTYGMAQRLSFLCSSANAVCFYTTFHEAPGRFQRNLVSITFWKWELCSKQVY